MRTYLPYPKLNVSVAMLEENELFLATATAADVLNVLHETFEPAQMRAWEGHPEVSKWKGFELQLAEYGLLALKKLERKQALRDHNTSGATPIKEILQWHFTNASSGSYSLELPPFMDNDEFHESEQSELVRCNPVAYRPKFPLADIRLPLYFAR